MHCKMLHCWTCRKLQVQQCSVLKCISSNFEVFPEYMHFKMLFYNIYIIYNIKFCWDLLYCILLVPLLNKVCTDLTIYSIYICTFKSSLILHCVIYWWWNYQSVPPTLSLPRTCPSQSKSGFSSSLGSSTSSHAEPWKVLDLFPHA